MRRLLLEMDQPASEWLERLPLGNGLIGAMPSGDPTTEEILLNHTHGWSGPPASGPEFPNIETCRTLVDDARAAALRRDWDGAAQAVQGLQGGNAQAFLPVGSLRITTSHQGIRDYRRTLDLAAGVHLVSSAGFVATTRVSYPAKVLLHVIEVDDPIDVAAEITTPLRMVRQEAEEQRLTAEIAFPTAAHAAHVGAEPVYDQPRHRAVVALEMTADAAVTADNGILQARGARRIECWLSIDTTFVGFREIPEPDASAAEKRATDTVREARRRGVDVVAAEQEADHARLFDASRLTLEPAGSLIETLWNYGRYLLICSSRPGGAPANLQGIWNWMTKPPWGSAWTTNINLEMNYWLAAATGLDECLEPLVAMLEGYAVTGAATARHLFDAPGWCGFHNTDLWVFNAPTGHGADDPSWSFWPMAGAWLLQTLRQGLARTPHPALVERLRPLIQGTTEFCLAWLGDNGLAPLGTSPENHFTDAGHEGTVGTMSTMDLALVRDSLEWWLDLEPDSGLADQVREALLKLPKLPIGDDGAVAEWLDPALIGDPTDRHTSHLYPLYPGCWDLSDAERDACRRTLERRGWESTGWALMWRVALWARLGDGEAANRCLQQILRDARQASTDQSGGMFPNLFASHPPFQMDANFGLTAGLTECLVQGRDDVIILLPAVPALASSGQVTGIHVDGLTVDLAWADGRVVEATLLSSRSRTITLRSHGDHTVELEANAATVWRPPAKE